MTTDRHVTPSEAAKLHSTVADLQARVALLESLVRALRDVNADLDRRLLEAQQTGLS